MTGRVGLGLAVIGGALIVFAIANKARATEYEIWASRPGAELRADAPNTYRLRDRNEEPFASLEDCRQVIRSAHIETRLGVKSGWRLRCEPVATPIERIVTR